QKAVACRSEVTITELSARILFQSRCHVYLRRLVYRPVIVEMKEQVTGAGNEFQMSNVNVGRWGAVGIGIGYDGPFFSIAGGFKIVPVILLGTCFNDEGAWQKKRRRGRVMFHLHLGLLGLNYRINERH